MPGKVVHFEIPYDDGDRAQGFYQEVFGWQLMPMPDMGYTIVTTGPTDEQTGPTEPGFINGGMFERGDDFSLGSSRGSCSARRSGSPFQ